MNGFEFTIIAKDKKSFARTGTLETPHGAIRTPAFIPVGTQASVKSLTPDELSTLGVQIFFVNTYHMYLRPGIEVIKRYGGLHRFMGWDGPVITDSAGFQVFSLAKAKDFVLGPSRAEGSLVKITEEGVQFRSHWDGTKHVFTPERSMEWQWNMGADIHIAFDDCTAYGVSKEKAKLSMERTHRWALRSLAAHQKIRRQPYQALYGVVQGSIFEDLRIMSAKYICSLDFDGIAIGGVSVGESKKEMKNVLTWVVPHLPIDKPRHLLGVGEIDDIFSLVEQGIDTFDCVQPTRLARAGILLVRNNLTPKEPNDSRKRFHLDIGRAMYAKDKAKIEKSCGCYTCRYFTRGYLHHLFHVRELLGYRLATIHNIHFMNTLLESMRQAIQDGTFVDLKKAWLYNT